MSRWSPSGVMNTHVPSGMPKNEGRSSELGPEMTAVWASWLAKSGHFRGTHPNTFVRIRVDLGVGYTKGFASYCQHYLVATVVAPLRREARDAQKVTHVWPVLYQERSFT